MMSGGTVLKADIDGYLIRGLCRVGLSAAQTSRRHGMDFGLNSIIKARWETHLTRAFRIWCAFIENGEFPTGIHTPWLPALSYIAGKGTTLNDTCLE